MENENSVIYGLEFQARALAARLAETEKIHFFIGTQSLKQSTNQIHLVDFEEEHSTVRTTVFDHSEGEIWKIATSPIDGSKLATCHNSVSPNENNTCLMKSAIYQLQDTTEYKGDNNKLHKVVDLENKPEDGHFKSTEFHLVDANKVGSVTESSFLLFDIGTTSSKSILNIKLSGKSNPKFTTGKWYPHQNGNQFTAATDVHLKTYDIRTGELSWTIDNAHNQLVRDLDFNMNKQCHVATCGDDGIVKIWDFRQPTHPVYSRSDHSHWVWCVRFNPFHDELLLTSSSDARVLISSAASVSSENNGGSLHEDTKQLIPDGPLQWCEHEDSVYCAEWSPAEPWIFASLSYDGRLLISRVKKSLKYQIML